MAFSLWKRKEPPFLLRGRPGHSENVTQHIAGRNVGVQVTYDGLSWGEYNGNPRALLFFTIQFSQPRGGILKDTQITFSFDCHPTEEGCHTESAREGCQNQCGRDRGVVDVSVPSSICGAKVDRVITRHFEYEAAPNFNIAPFGTISLGHIRGESGYTQYLERNWDFTSRISPPTRYKKFPERTDVSYEWKHNKNDIELYPKSINVAVIVDCGQARHGALPLTLRIDGSLGGMFPYFSKLKDHEVSLAINKELKDPDALIQRIDRLAYQSDTLGLGVVTFEVECLDTSEDAVTVKLLGNVDILGCWQRERASALTKIRDDGERAVWKIDKLVNMWQDFEYKFIKGSNGGRDIVWESGDNRTYSRHEAGTKPRQRRPIWE